MTIPSLSVSYPDFKLLDVMDPEQFDINNNEIVTRVNEIRNVVNLLTDGATGAAQITLNQISPFISIKLQDFLQEMVTRLQATTTGVSGSDFVGTPPIVGVTGTTIAAQLNSLKTLLDAVNTDLQTDKTALATHKASGDHDVRYTQKTGDHQGTWLGLTPSQAADATINGSRLDVIEGNNHLAKTAQSLTGGMQVINSTSKGNVPFNVLSFVGRTLVNLIGRDGNCEDTSKWGAGSGTLALDTANFAYGSNSIKVTLSAPSQAVMTHNQNILPLLSTSKTYLFVAEIKMGTATNGVLYWLPVGGGALPNPNAITSTTAFQISYGILDSIQLTGMTSLQTRVAVNGNSGQTAFADGIRVYEITAAEKAYINGLSVAAAQAYIATKYPYIDDLKNTNAVYITKRGENQAPSLVEWQVIDSHATILEPYKLVLTATANSQYNSFVADLMPNMDYSFSATHNGKIGIYEIGGTVPVVAYTTAQTLTFNSGTRKQVIVIFSNDTLGAGTFNCTNPMLNLGAVPLSTFKPRVDQSIYLPNVQAASNMDGSIVDTVSNDGKGKMRITRRLKTIDLDGSLPWNFNASTTNVKRVTLNATDAPKVFGLWTPYAGYVVRYDGKILNNFGNTAPNVAANIPDNFILWPDSFYLDIPQSSSGWGDSYNPTQAEIQAYFNGWAISATNTTPSPYTGAGNKYWYEVGTSPTTSPGYTAANDVNYAANNAINNAKTKRYRLQYQLAASVDEFVESEGSVTFHEVANQMEMGTGIVARERSNPFSSGTAVAINSSFGGETSSQLKYRANKILTIYRNREIDKKWNRSTAYAYGNERANIVAFSEWDPSATYEVTYLALDTYTLGIAPQTISGEYMPNIRETVDELAKRSADVVHRVSVLERSAPNKSLSNFINIGLLNGWSAVAGIGIQFRKINDDELEVRGVLNNVSAAAVGTVLGICPIKPQSSTSFIALNYSTVNDGTPMGIDFNIAGEFKVGILPAATGKPYILFTVILPLRS